MNKTALKLATALVGAFAITAALQGCASSPAPESTGTAGAEAVPIRVQLGWYPQAQHGGWFTALEEGYFADAGLDVTLLPGGPQVSGLQLVAAGQVDVATSIPEEVIKGVDKDIPLVAISADMDKSPLGVMFKTATGWTDWQDLNGRTWIVSDWNPGWKVIKSTQGLDFTTQSNTGNVSVFLAKDDLVQEGYYTSDLYAAQKTGAEVEFLPYSSAGYDPYGAVLVTTPAFLEENAEVAAKLVAALQQGWVTYMTDLDAAERANAAIMKANPEMDEASLWFEWDVQRALFIGDREGQPMSLMSEERWAQTIADLKELGDVTGDVKPSDVFTNDYLSTDVITPKLADLPEAPPNSYVGQ